VCYRSLFRCLNNVLRKLLPTGNEGRSLCGASACQSCCQIYIYIYKTFKDFSDTSSSVLIAAPNLIEVKWLSWVKCVYSHLFIFIQPCLCSVQYVVSSLFASISYFQITRFMIFNILFVFVFCFVYSVILYCFVYYFSRIYLPLPYFWTRLTTTATGWKSDCIEYISYHII